ncbi:hypothetical protein IscW_ISCW018216 [Ixodes scapularis]|uniref:Uncharacterized protein n=1 Tax=Ixodes scapularis TaxID=6945 RepID=B7PJC5_IXOSC|nr:hypothetical protein IscW_ISCW018216 [Ixodes scapularis]|eukprot:XP_002407593.1 hypothetical protein IscW_ISCW018216 [Ixodes scapularis]
MECANRTKCWDATVLEGEENPVKCWGGHIPPLCHHLRSFDKRGGKLGGDKLAGRASDSHNIQNGVAFLKSRNGESAFSRPLPHTRQKAISRLPRSISLASTRQSGAFGSPSR